MKIEIKSCIRAESKKWLIIHLKSNKYLCTIYARFMHDLHDFAVHDFLEGSCILVHKIVRLHMSDF